MGTVVVSLVGSALCVLLGWFLRRLVSQVDIAITQLRERQDAEREAREKADADLRDRVAVIAARVDTHAAEHMLGGGRLGRRSDDVP